MTNEIRVTTETKMMTGRSMMCEKRERRAVREETGRDEGCSSASLRSEMNEK